MANDSRPWGNGTPTWVRDSRADDSDKSFTVPAGKAWAIISIEAQLNATATVGNRDLNISISDASGNRVQPGKTSAHIAASQIGMAYAAVGISEGTVARARFDAWGAPIVEVVSNLSHGTILTSGMTIRVLDVSAVDPAADDLTVVLHYMEYDA